MVGRGPSGRHGVSSILLSAPGYDGDFALWAGPVFAMLESGVGAVQAEEIVGVVCFHPECELPGRRSTRGPLVLDRTARAKLTSRVFFSLVVLF